MRDKIVARSRGGVSLVEVALVLAIVALLVAGVVLFFGNASDARAASEALTELGSIQQVVRSLYMGQPDYGNLSASVIVANGQMPRKWLATGGGLTSPFLSAVTVGPAGSGNAQFAVRMTGVTKSACAKMSTVDLGTAFVSVAVGSNLVSQRAMTPNEANLYCGASPNVLTWTFL